MKTRLVLKWALALIVLLGIGAIVANFLSRRVALPETDEPSLLEEDVARRSTEFEHSQYRAGRKLFQVNARTNTLTAAGVHQLRDVELRLFDEVGEVSDSVAGANAVYHIERKQIEFEGAVQVLLHDGTAIDGQQMEADLEHQVIRIKDDFSFARGDATGSGRSLVYQIESRVMDVAHGFELRQSRLSPPALLRSKQAVYNLRNPALALSGGATFASSGYRLEGSSIVLKLTDQHQIAAAEASGGTRLALDGQRAFQGDRIDFAFAGSPPVLTSFDVSTAEGASSFVDSAPGGQSLRARRIRVETSRGDADELHLNRLEAHEEVQLQKTDSALRSASAERLDGLFGPQGQLARLQLRQQAEMSGEWSGREFSLRAHDLSLSFSAEGALERLLAIRDVRLKQPKAAAGQLTADGSLELFFEGTNPRNAICQRNCVLLHEDPSEAGQLESDRVEIQFSEGLPARVQASDGVRTASRGEGSIQQTESREMTIEYRNGLLDRVLQSGSVSLIRSGGGNDLQITGDEAIYSAASQEIEVRGQQPELTQGASSTEKMVTRARQFLINRSSNRLLAEGRVSSRINREGSVIDITAERMEAVDEWVEYRGDPRISEAGHVIEGGIIRLNEEAQLMLVAQGVRSRFETQPGAEQKTYDVTASRLQYERARRRALYEENVVAVSEEMTLRAANMEIFFEEDSQERLKKLTAWEAVRVEDSVRTAIGDRAYYDPAANRVEVTGNPASVTDQQQGKAYGARLIFFPGSEQMIIEAQPSRAGHE